MNEIKRIRYNCRKATFLIEKKLIGKITLRERLELKIHQAGCSICKTFEQQSIIINKMVSNLFNTANRQELKLDENFKKELQEHIEEQLGKN